MTEEKAESCITRHENKSQSINLAVEAWLACEKEAKQNLKGKFVIDELSAFIDLMNSTITLPLYTKSFKYKSEDACALDNMEEKWGLTQYDVVSMIDRMSMAEYIVLIQWAKAFWDNPEQDIKEYAKQMA